ncbi:hypothetical protein KR222_001278, partial [Zaprionus bogoriensis]
FRMQLVLVLAIITALAVTVQSTALRQPRRYDNYAVYKVHIENPAQRHLINSLLNHPDKYNLWHNARSEMHIMVNPQELQNFKRIVREEGISLELLIANVQ